MESAGSRMENRIVVLLTKSRKIHIFAIVLVSLIAFSNSLTNGFVGDDNGFITNNFSIRDIKKIPSSFYDSSIMAADAPEWGTAIYRPLRTISFAIDYYFFGLNPTGYHATSLGLHILACISLYFLMLSFFDLPGAAFLGTLIFAVHPVHVEAISWIASRADLIGFLFFNLSLLCYISYRKNLTSVKYLALSVFLSLMAYLGKETMVSLPGIIIMYDYVNRNRKTLNETVKSCFPAWLMFIIVCMAYLVLRFWMTGRMSTDQSWWGGSPGSNFLMVTKATATYLKLLLFPFKLNFHYIIEPVNNVLNLKVMVSILAILLTLAMVLYFHRINRKIFFLLIWFYLCLVPIANIVPISFSMMAERYIYMPSAGPIMAIGYGLYLLYKWLKEEKGIAVSCLFSALVIIVVIAFTLKDINRNRAYKNDFTFYATAVKDSPFSAPSHKGLGDQYKQRKKYLQALASYDKAIDIDPYYASAMINKAMVFLKLKNFPAARTQVEKAILYKPDSAVIRYIAGNIYKNLGDWAKAIEQWEMAVELNPGYSDAYMHLGNYFHLIKNRDAAIRNYKRALDINSKNARAHHNIALNYEVLRNREQARYHFNRFMEFAGPEYKSLMEKIRKKHH